MGGVSDKIGEEILILALLTGIQRIWNGVKHVCVHVRVDRPVGCRVVTRSDENGVTLSYGDAQNVNWELFNVSLFNDMSLKKYEEVMQLTYPVNLDDSHIMSIDPEVKCSK